MSSGAFSHSDSTPASLENIKILEMLVTQHQRRLARPFTLKSFSGDYCGACHMKNTKILCYFPDFKDIISVTS